MARIKSHYVRRNRSSGFSLLELLLVVGIGVSLAVMAFRSEIQQAETERAHRLGVELAQYNNAVRAYLSGLPEQLSATPMTFPATFSGSAWLKDASCGGGGTQRYLPCHFGDSPSAFKGLGDYVTTITQDASGDFIAVTRIGSVVINGDTRGDLAGAAARVASSTSPANGAPVWSSTFAAFAANDNPETGAGMTMDDLGAVYARASTGPSSDAWLRVDGSNKMLADLDMGGHDMEEARDVHSKRLVDRDDPYYALEPAALSRLKGVDILGSDKAAGGSGAQEGVLRADNVVAHNKAVSPVFEDLDDTRFLADPNQTSTLSHLEVTGTDKAVNFLTASPSSRWGTLETDALLATQRTVAPVYLDTDDASGVLFNPSAAPRFIIDLDKVSQIHGLEVTGNDGAFVRGNGTYSPAFGIDGVLQGEWTTAWQAAATTTYFDLNNPSQYRLDLDKRSVWHALLIDPTSQGGRLVAPQLRDAESLNFVIDPSDTTYLKNLTVAGSDGIVAKQGPSGWGHLHADGIEATGQIVTATVFDRDDPLNAFTNSPYPKYHLNMNGESMFHSLTLDRGSQGGHLTAPILIDSDNNNYYLDPQNEIKLNNITFRQQAIFNAQVDFNNTASLGGTVRFYRPVRFDKRVTFADNANFTRNVSFGDSISIANTLTADTGVFKQVYVGGIEVGQKLNEQASRLNAQGARLASNEARLNNLEHQLNTIKLIPGPPGAPGPQGPPGPKGPPGPDAR